MYCGNCGAENENGVKFCEKCGSPLADDVQGMQNIPPQQNPGGAGSNGSAPIPNVNAGQPAGGIKSVPKKVLAGAGAGLAALVVLIIIICIAANSGKTIDLNKYIVVEASGYDGYGTASAAIDWDAIRQKYGSRLSFTNSAKSEFGGLLSMVTPVDAIRDYVSVTLDENSGLSNGTEISYTWDVNEELKKYVKCKIKYKDGTYTVSGLTEVATFDAFADLTVEFSGIAPNGRANLNYTGSDMNYYDFSCDKTDALSNGDTVTVTINDSNMEYYAESLGKVPESLKKEYTVEGLESYLLKISEIDDDALKAMQQQAEDVYNAYVAQDWGEGESLQGLTYMGNYLLTAKNKNSSRNSALYLVYKAQIKNSYVNGEETYDQVNDGYWYIEFDNLTVSSDGKVSVDVTNYSTARDRFTIDSGISSGWWSTKSWNYYGYPTLDELYKKVVTSNMDSYNHEDNVGESAAPGTAAEE